MLPYRNPFVRHQITKALIGGILLIGIVSLWAVSCSSEKKTTGQASILYPVYPQILLGDDYVACRMAGSPEQVAVSPSVASSASSRRLSISPESLLTLTGPERDKLGEVDINSSGLSITTWDLRTFQPISSRRIDMVWQEGTVIRVIDGLDAILIYRSSAMNLVGQIVDVGSSEVTEFALPTGNLLFCSGSQKSNDVVCVLSRRSKFFGDEIVILDRKTGNSRRIAAERVGLGEVRLGVDGSLFATVTSDQDRIDLISSTEKGLAEGRREILFQGLRSPEFVLHPVTTDPVIISDHLKSDYRYDVFMVPKKGGELLQLTHEASYIKSLNISPSGRWVAYSVNPDQARDNSGGQVKLIDLSKPSRTGDGVLGTIR